MQNPKRSFLHARLKAFQYAFKGLKKLIFSEDSFKAQFLIGLFAILLGLLFKISTIEWMMQLICIGLMLSTEALNTAVEKIADYIQPNYHKEIETIKDIGAGAALIAAIISLILGCIIYIPKILILFS